MSKHFPLSEFKCKDGTQVPPHLVPNCERVADVLEVIRAADGRPQEVVSGYRSPAYNSKKKGAKMSRHMTAEAADIRPIIKVAGIRVPWALVRNKVRVIAEYHAMIFRMIQEGELNDVGGLGLYSGKWVHIDIRPRPASGRIAQWTGEGFGSEQVA